MQIANQTFQPPNEELDKNAVLQILVAHVIKGSILMLLICVILGWGKTGPEFDLNTHTEKSNHYTNDNKQILYKSDAAHCI